MFKSINDLDLGFYDAENYKRKENKTALNRCFLRTDDLDKVLLPQISFLIGEKGTGKTAYAVFLKNNNYKDTISDLKYIRETEYQKFVTLKNEKHLALSDYTNIWTIIIYVLLAAKILEAESKNVLLDKFSGLVNIKKAIDEYYANAFSPEILYAITFAEDSKVTAELVAKHLKSGVSQSNTVSFSETKFQTNLMYLKKQFEEALSKPKLSSNHLIFLDGIDIRPGNIPYQDYLECIKGLANAVWAINNDFLSSIKDSSKGRMKIVLLIRPDIFASLGLQNQNTKIRDNSVFLDWKTNYRNHRSSGIFELINKILSSQQTFSCEKGQAWDHYFPYDVESLDYPIKGISSFIDFLRFSFYRPRDIVAALHMIKERAIEQKDTPLLQFSPSDFRNASFRRDYSTYLLGEIRDQFSFYYTEDEYKCFIKFFHHLKGSIKFNYAQYVTAHDVYLREDINGNKEMKFPTSKNDFLQFLYELNIICYKIPKEGDKRYIYWSFNERDYGNPTPKVEINRDYEIFYGLGKALNLGVPDRGH